MAPSVAQTRHFFIELPRKRVIFSYISQSKHFPATVIQMSAKNDPTHAFFQTDLTLLLYRDALLTHCLSDTIKIVSEFFFVEWSAAIHVKNMWHNLSIINISLFNFWKMNHSKNIRVQSYIDGKNVTPLLMLIWKI